MNFNDPDVKAVLANKASSAWIKDGIDMEPMVEKIARSIFVDIAWAFKWERPLIYAQLNEHAKNTLRNIARNALNAMREPTVEMRKASTFEVCEIEWPKMIDAAIKVGNIEAGGEQGIAVIGDGDKD